MSILMSRVTSRTGMPIPKERFRPEFYEDAIFYTGFPLDAPVTLACGATKNDTPACADGWHSSTDFIVRPS